MLIATIGGVVYPIILQRLFEHIGFAWGVRISGLASGVACIAATMMVTSLSRQKKPGPYFDVKTIADLRFALLAIGSCFVALGKCHSHIYSGFLTRIVPFRHFRSFHTIFLHRGVRTAPITSKPHVVLCVGCHECGRRAWKNCARLYLRQRRAVQPPHSLRILLWALLRCGLVIRKVLGFRDAVLLAIWILFGSVHLARYAVCRANFGDKADGYQDWHAIQLHFVPVSEYLFNSRLRLFFRGISISRPRARGAYLSVIRWT